MSVFSASNKIYRTPPNSKMSGDTIGIDKFKELMTEMRDDIVSHFSSSIDEIKQSVQKINSNEKVLSEKVVTLESDKLRKNLIIKGIIETEENSEQLERSVLEFINSKLLVEINISDIDVIFRLGKKKINFGKPRPIILKLISERKKIEILKNKMLLKGTQFYIEKDCTKETQQIEYEKRVEKRKKKVLENEGKSENNKRPRSKENTEEMIEYEKSPKEPHIQVQSPTPELEIPITPLSHSSQ